MAEEVPYAAYYETAPLTAPGWSARPARVKLGKLLREHGLTLMLRRNDGVEEEIRHTSSRIEDGTAIMAMAFLHGAERGAETDSVVAGTHQDLLLASFWWNQDKLVVQQAHYHEGLLREGPSEQVLRDRYGVGRLVEEDRPWDPFSRGLVEQAYQHLTEQERDLLSYLSVHRVREPMGDRDAARYYHEDARIELYDIAVAQSSAFVGEVNEPYPYSLRVLVHELGHALMFAPERATRLLSDQIAAELELGHTPASRQALEALHDWLGSNPVLDAYIIAIGDEAAPTEYGRTRVIEGFAESFALWHLDPAALRRTSPRAAAFFDAHGHIEAVQRAIAQVEAVASEAWSTR